MWALARRVERPISPEMVAFRRGEEMRRLRMFFTGGRPGPAGPLDPPVRSV
jgi:hypothetical protein